MTRAVSRVSSSSTPGSGRAAPGSLTMGARVPSKSVATRAPAGSTAPMKRSTRAAPDGSSVLFAGINYDIAVISIRSPRLRVWWTELEAALRRHLPLVAADARTAARTAALAAGGVAGEVRHQYKMAQSTHRSVPVVRDARGRRLRAS